MIFVLEHYLKRRQDRIRAWEDAGEAWVNEDTGSYHYRSMREWERDHPYPAIRWKKIQPYIITTVGGLVALAFIVCAATGQFASDSTSGDPRSDCKVKVEKGQSVGVSYGDFKGSKGTVIQQTDSCDVDITLTDSTNTFDICKKSNDKSYCDNTLENGKILHIDSSSNVVPL